MIHAAKRYGSRAIGYEIDPHLVQLARGNVQAERLESLVRLEHEDIFSVDLREVDVVVVYLPASLLVQLLPKFEKLKPGARIVSHQFAIPGIRTEQSERFISAEDGDSHTIYVWTVPLAKSRR